MAEEINYGDMMSNFPQTGRYIKLPNVGDSYTGVFQGFSAVKMGSFGPQYPALFVDEDGTEKELSCGKALMDAFAKCKAVPGLTTTVVRGEVEGTNRETGEPNGQTYTVYEVTQAAGVPKAAAKPAAKKAAVDDEINIDDVPFA